MIHKIEFIREGVRMIDKNVFKESGEKHSVGKCHIDTFGHTHHTVCNVVGEVEVFSNGEADDFPFIELDFQLGENHLTRIKEGINTFHLLGLGLSWVKFFHKIMHHGSKMSPHKEEEDKFISKLLMTKAMAKKAIKPNSRESRTDVGLIIKKSGVDGATLMKETGNERFVDLSFMSGSLRFDNTWECSERYHGDQGGWILA
ncbi:hypothetical protein Tco_1412631 [Tanacetum coccineum]